MPRFKNAQRKRNMLTLNAVRNLPGVVDTGNLRVDYLKQRIDLVFWLCPNMTSAGWRFNSETNTLRAEFQPGLRDSSVGLINRVLTLKEQLEQLGCKINSVTVMFATADAILLLETPVEFPDAPSELSVVDVISTGYLVDRKYLQEWGKWRRTKPWKLVPGRFLNLEKERLKTIPWNSVPAWLMDNWIERIFAGYAQDGVWVKRNFTNPIIVGVESRGVAVLQNAALSKKDWIPVIQIV